MRIYDNLIMFISRVYQAVPLKEDSIIELDEVASHHIARVLRAKNNDRLIIFNGRNGEYESIIQQITKKKVTILIKQFIPKNTESSLELYLAQGISRGEKMDYTIQKSVELGVKKIIPLKTERCNVKIDKEKMEKKLQHWRSIIISACEQSGRTALPEILFPLSFDQFLKEVNADWKFVLAPTFNKKLIDYSVPKNASIIVLIGPEGGLSQEEIDASIQNNFLSLNLGPRVLRTETAGVTALSLFQHRYGDL